MKANQHSLWKDDKRAQVGIGTMIVFIATILVAATAAAVLIDTSGKLQERSSSTGNQATEQVASNLIVKGVYGGRTGGTGDLQGLNITVALAPGATTLDLNQTRIVMSNGDKRVDLKHAYAETELNSTFLHSELRDPKNTMNNVDTAVMTAGSLVNVKISLLKISDTFTIGTRDSVTLLILPEVGSPVHADFHTPASFGTDNLIVFR